MTKHFATNHNDIQNNNAVLHDTYRNNTKNYDTEHYEH
jgi:hypothetical protein